LQPTRGPDRTVWRFVTPDSRRADCKCVALRPRDSLECGFEDDRRGHPESEAVSRVCSRPIYSRRLRPARAEAIEHAVLGAARAVFCSATQAAAAITLFNATPSLGRCPRGDRAA